MCMGACICILCAHASMHMCVYLSMCSRVCVHLRICMLHVYVFVCTSLYALMCVYVCACVCMYDHRVSCTCVFEPTWCAFV